jgi:hypothetical protein
MYLNALVSSGEIKDYQPGQLLDWEHTTLRISYDSPEDASRGKNRLSTTAYFNCPWVRTAYSDETSNAT